MSLNFTPRKIVQELDRFIVGQNNAKKAVAIALRNRWRRKKLTPELRDEIMPKNILMVGPTGVGKTEIARRLAKLSGAPFIKVEATKFTEVGYVGRDVESIIRDLSEISIKMQKDIHHAQVKEKAHNNAVNKILDILVGPNAEEATREDFRNQIISGKIDDKEIEIETNLSTNNTAPIDFSSGSMGVINLSDMIGKALNQGKKKLRSFNIKEALEILEKEEAELLSDEDSITKAAIDAIENEGIVFLDEIDKIVVRSAASNGREVSREGVQRDLLPLLEGTSVATKYGTIKTDHILFICSGAFHLAKPSDLLPELQGRLPIRVELNPLSSEDMLNILTDPENSLPVQYQALLAVEGLNLKFTDDGLNKIAAISSEVNKKVENIGARRLQTIMEKILEEISFNADEMDKSDIIIDSKFVEQNIEEANLQNLDDLSKFIL